MATADSDILEGLDYLYRQGDHTELAHWILTGSPEQVNLRPTRQPYVDRANPRITAMIEAAASADPAVEWRLRLLLCEGRNQPAGPIAALLQFPNGGWPTAERTASMLAAAGVSETNYLLHVLLRGAGGGAADHRLPIPVRELPIFEQLLRDHHDAVMRWIEQPKERWHSAAVVRSLVRDPYVEFFVLSAERIVDLATAADKRHRRHGRDLAHLVPYDAIEAPLRRRIREAEDGHVRAEAIRLWTRRAGNGRWDEVASFCASHANDDGRVEVQRALQELADIIESPVGLPTVEWPTVDVDNPTEAEQAAILEMFRDAHRQAVKSHRTARSHAVRPLDEWDAENPPPSPPPDTTIDAIWRYLTSGTPEQERVAFLRETGTDLQLGARDVADRLRPIYGFRLLSLVNRVWVPPCDRVPTELIAGRYATTGRPTPLEVQAAAEAHGYSRDQIISSLQPPLAWSDDDIRPWAAALLPEITWLIESEANHSGLCDAVATLDEIPVELRQILMRQSLGEHRSVSSATRRGLNGRPGLVETVLDCLAGSEAVERAQAALWLGEISATAAIPNLHAAVEIETDVVARLAQLLTLQLLGEDVSAYPDIASTFADAMAASGDGPPSTRSQTLLQLLPLIAWPNQRSGGRLLGRSLADQLVRLTELQQRLGPIRTVDKSPNNNIYPAVLKRFPEWKPPPDLLALRDHWPRLPVDLLPGWGELFDLSSGSSAIGDWDDMYASNYRRYLEAIDDEDERAAATMMPEAVFLLFFSESDQCLGMETVGPAAGAIFWLDVFGEKAGWVARSLSELIDRACLLLEFACGKASHGSVWLDGSEVQNLVTNTTNTPSAGSYVSDYLVDPRLIMPGFDNESHWFRWRWS